jgi:mannose-6-phosphate isomerase-like protein (cupin superfamily)
MAIDPRQTYVHLAADGAATELPGGDAFWSQSDAELDRFGRGWLVAEFQFDADWPNWEMHPDADEFVYLLSGSADLLLEGPGGTETIALRERAAVLVPRGAWHTATVHAPSRMLHVTMGSGTQHRPR